MCEKVICFEEEYLREKPEISFERGILDVPMDKITGTVGRYRDFEQSNQLRSVDSGKRLQWLREELSARGDLPPIELYKLKDNYFILDGHHRHTIAQNAGQQTIKARVVEYLPPRNSQENILAWEKSRFERMSGLSEILLTELSQYDKLLDQIREHKYYLSERAKKEIPFKETALDWYEKIYRPVTRELDPLLKSFPQRTIGDLYAYISDFKWIESKKRGYDIGFHNAISHFQIRHEQNVTLMNFFKNLFQKKEKPRQKVFRIKTGIEGIFLSRDYSYTLLMKQIKEHKYYLSEKKRENISLHEAAEDWYYEVYSPIVHLIEKERKWEFFPSKTVGELYIMLSEIKWLESEKKGYDIGFQRAVKKLMQGRRPSAILRKFMNFLWKKFMPAD